MQPKQGCRWSARTGWNLALNLAMGPLVLLLATAALRAASGPDHVAANLIMLNDNAGWCWYQDERVISDPVAGSILASTIANAKGYEGTPREADVDVTAFFPATGRRLRVTMGKRNSYRSGDDHNVGALWIRPDGRYLHVWTGHNEATRNCYFRISEHPHDASVWRPEQTFNWPAIGNPDKGGQHSATYNNLHFLADEREGKGRLYDVTRESQRSPNIAYSDDLGETWHYGGKLTLTRTRSSYSNGYVKFSSNGKNRIDFITTEHHPRDYNTSIYHGYVQGGQSFDSTGRLIDENVFDENAPAPEDFTPVFMAAAEDGVNDDQEYHRAWTVELECDAQGHLYALFTTRYGTAQVIKTPGEADHRLFYARWDGRQWDTSEIAHMGGPLWRGEEDYVGLGAIDPDQPSVVYVSTNRDPRDGAHTPKREIYRGETPDLGSTWTWTAITSHSTVDNLRPSIPRWDADHTAVWWLRGTYDSQSAFDQTLVGIVEDRTLRVDKVRFIDATGENTKPVTGPWRLQSGIGNGDGVFVADGREEARSDSLLRTKISGLARGTYDVFAYFWSKDDEEGQLRGGFEPSEMLVFRRCASQRAELGQFHGAIKESGPEGGMYRAYIGRRQVADGGSLEVCLGAFSGRAHVAYDGLGVARVQ